MNFHVPILRGEEPDYISVKTDNIEDAIDTAHQICVQDLRENGKELDKARCINVYDWRFKR